MAARRRKARGPVSLEDLVAGWVDAPGAPAPGAYAPTSKGVYEPNSKGAYAPNSKGAYAPNSKGAYAPNSKGVYAPKPKGAVGGVSFAAGPPPVDEIAWRRIVGMGVALRSRPVRFVRGTLWVKVASSAWAQELSLLQSTLVARLAAYGLQVEHIRFQVGEIGPPTRAPRVEAPPPKAPKAELPGELMRALDAVGDDELRQTLAEAAALNLAWQEGLVISRKRAVRGPRFAAAESARPAQTRPSGSEDPRRNPAGRRG